MLIIRRAKPADRRAVRRLIRQAGLNFTNLQWPRFVVAHDLARDRIAGVGQIRIHRDGAHELASIAVAPTYAHQGIGRAIVATLISQSYGNGAGQVVGDGLFLFCRGEMASFYQPFGFVVVDPQQMPASMGWMLRLGQFFGRVLSRLQNKPVSVVGMHRRRLASSRGQIQRG